MLNNALILKSALLKNQAEIRVKTNAISEAK